MIAYDVQIEDPSVLYMTFDNVGVGRLMAQEMLKVKDEGNFAIIKGDPGDPNATFLYSGMMEVLKPKYRLPARSRSLAKHRRTAGSRKMPRRTWSRS